MVSFPKYSQHTKQQDAFIEENNDAKGGMLLKLIYLIQARVQVRVKSAHLFQHFSDLPH